jgi:hypothetical protein
MSGRLSCRTSRTRSNWKDSSETRKWNPALCGGSPSQPESGSPLAPLRFRVSSVPFWAAQICQSIAAAARSRLVVTDTRRSSMSTNESAGTLCIRNTFAPTVVPAPITVSPPTMVALA